MSSERKHESVAGEELSALVDGEVDATQAQRLCAAWRDDASTRATWYAYQLIGDVLRSEDLASDPSLDAAFMMSLRARLAKEPVVLAPQPLGSGPRTRTNDGLRRRRTWIASSAVAAGFVAVAGVTVVLRGTDETSAAAVMASSGATQASAPVTVVAATPVPRVVAVEPEPPMQTLNGQMIRDARLDRYLAAHKQFAGSSALGVPSSFLRSATVDAAASR